MDRFGSYAEVSPCGTGAKVIFLAATAAKPELAGMLTPSGAELFKQRGTDPTPYAVERAITPQAKAIHPPLGASVDHNPICLSARLSNVTKGSKVTDAYSSRPEISPYQQNGLHWFTASGAPRSGTTMLARLLNTHPAIGCLNEVPLTSFVSHLNPFFSDRAARVEAAEKIAERTASCLYQEEPSRVELFWRSREESLGDSGYGTDLGVWDLDLHAAASARAMVEVALGKMPLTHIGSKLPNLDLLEDWRTLKSTLPGLKYVHIVRRPRDVVNSSLARRSRALIGKDVWHIDTVEEACKEWLTDWNRAEVAGCVLGKRLLRLRYEDLVSQNPRITTMLADHLAIEDAFDLSVCRPLDHDLHGYALTSEEDDKLASMLGEIDKCWTEPLDALRTRFNRYGFALPPSGIIKFGLDDEGGLYSDNGFSVPEAWGRWTDGEQARIDIGLDSRSGDILLTLVFQGFQAAAEHRFECVVSADGWHEVISVDQADRVVVKKSFIIPRIALNNPTRLNLVFLMLNPKNKDKEPVGEVRQLGLALHEMRVRVLETSASSPVHSPNFAK